MTIAAAYRIAHQWAFCFASTFFVIEIAPDTYGVTSSLAQGDHVVARVQAA